MILNLTEDSAIMIAKQYKEKFSNLKNTPVRAELNLFFDVEGDKAWIVTGEFELFGEIREFFYVISDQTGEVAYTFDELGNRDPHIERLMPKEQEDYLDEYDQEMKSFLYQGQYYDFETKLAYNRFRYYSPETGGYISQDPIRLSGNNPNLYAYVGDSNWKIDIFGLSEAYEVDTYGNLQKNDVTNNKLGNHHAPQKALAKIIIKGYPQDTNALDAPAIRLPDSEHSIITKLQSKNKEARSKMTATELLQNDIDMLREHTNAPEESINKLIEMNKEKYGITYT